MEAHIVKYICISRSVQLPRRSEGRNSDMEEMLGSLFALQRFTENRELQDVIDSVHARYARRELSMDDLDYVSAAGVQHPVINKYGTESKK